MLVMRDIGGIGVIAAVVLLAIVGSGALLWGISAPQSAPTRDAHARADATIATTTPVPFTVIATGEQSLVATRTNYVIATQDELDKVWRMADQAGVEPTVDFSKHFVLAVFAGEEPGARYSIAVTNVADTNTERMVSIELSSPGSNCAVTGTSTEPYQFVELSATTLAYAHRDTATTTGCVGSQKL